MSSGNQVPVLGTENGEAARQENEGRSRRDLLKALGVAAAGVVAGGVLSPKEAQAHGTFHADSSTAAPAIHGNNTNGGPGVQGDSSSGYGVQGTSTDGWGVYGFSNSDNGVRGESDSDGGVQGLSNSGTGVQGSTLSGIGVRGESNTNIGVQGFSNMDWGVMGQSNQGNGVVGFSEQAAGVAAIGGSSEIALTVLGKAIFSTAGAGAIPAGQNAVAVNDSAVTSDSHITMTLTGNPGSTGSGLPAVVVWVQRQPGTGFTAHLSRRVSNSTPFTYLIVEPG
jgi:TAT (twin-arginine translocation) pathway signal sequence